ncbi:hypothetical protein AURDEDRAFT_178355 [Auricularia subglabra TFB-10046 SS5]|uniref:Uncharacterized protein n=1 Tax=Auricularia subglabra (strain TFB-10046 / SS5) TaxID=717982 RepID=J0L8A8_AURST|nr:hypothetical protein AURDEDRAFT_178355 [Auricularia subglabra TFB-10046 SS5]
MTICLMKKSESWRGGTRACDLHGKPRAWVANIPRHRNFRTSTQQPPQSLCGPPSSLAFLPPPSRPPLSSPSPLLSLAAADDFDSSSGRSAALSTCSLDDAFDDREHLLSLMDAENRPINPRPGALRAMQRLDRGKLLAGRHADAGRCVVACRLGRTTAPSRPAVAAVSWLTSYMSRGTTGLIEHLHLYLRRPKASRVVMLSWVRRSPPGRPFSGTSTAAQPSQPGMALPPQLRPPQWHQAEHEGDGHKVQRQRRRVYSRQAQQQQAPVLGHTQSAKEWGEVMVPTQGTISGAVATLAGAASARASAPCLRPAAKKGNKPVYTRWQDVPLEDEDDDATLADFYYRRAVPGPLPTVFVNYVG